MLSGSSTFGAAKAEGYQGHRFKACRQGFKPL